MHRYRTTVYYDDPNVGMDALRTATFATEAEARNDAESLADDFAFFTQATRIGFVVHIERADDPSDWMHGTPTLIDTIRI